MSRVRVISGVALLVFVVALWLSGEGVAATWLRWLSLASLAAVAVDYTYERWLWAKPPIAMATPTPDLRGTWKGTLQTQWTNPETGQTPGPKQVYLVVSQTASTIRLGLFTDESRSNSTAAELQHEGTGPVLSYVYFNRPDIDVADRSRAHFGGASLYVTGKPPISLHGRYWTERDSKGEIQFYERTRKQCTGYGEAQAHFQASSNE